MSLETFVRWIERSVARYQSGPESFRGIRKHRATERTIHRTSSKLDRSFEDEICRTRQRDVLELFAVFFETHFQFVPTAHVYSDRASDPLGRGENARARNDASSAREGFVFDS